MFIKIVNTPIQPDQLIYQAKSNDSGCVVTYVGLIRDSSHGQPVRSVEYRDTDGQAEARLKKLAEELLEKFSINNLVLCHRVGELKVGDINIIFAFACGHRQECFAACSYAVDRFKEAMPTAKKETYLDGTFNSEW